MSYIAVDLDMSTSEPIARVKRPQDEEWNTRDEWSTTASFEVSSIENVRKTDIAIINEVYVEDVYDARAVDFDGGVVIDAGAHIGVFTTRVAQAGAQVHAYDADAFNCRRLLRNTTANGVSELAQVTHAAIVADCRLKMDSVRDADTGMSEVKRADGGTTPCITLSEVVRTAASAGPVKLLKMDIEGFEYEAICEAASVLHLVEHIAMEWHVVSDPVVLGEMVTTILRTHAVRVFGVPHVGGMLHATRYEGT